MGIAPTHSCPYTGCRKIPQYVAKTNNWLSNQAKLGDFSVTSMTDSKLEKTDYTIERKDVEDVLKKITKILKKDGRVWSGTGDGNPLYQQLIEKNASRYYTQVIKDPESPSKGGSLKAVAPLTQLAVKQSSRISREHSRDKALKHQHHSYKEKPLQTKGPETNTGEDVVLYQNLIQGKPSREYTHVTKAPESPSKDGSPIATVKQSSRITRERPREQPKDKDRTLKHQQSLSKEKSLHPKGPGTLGTKFRSTSREANTRTSSTQRRDISASQDARQDHSTSHQHRGDATASHLLKEPSVSQQIRPAQSAMPSIMPAPSQISPYPNYQQSLVAVPTAELTISPSIGNYQYHYPIFPSVPTQAWVQLSAPIEVITRGPSESQQLAVASHLEAKAAEYSLSHAMQKHHRASKHSAVASRQSAAAVSSAATIPRTIQSGNVLKTFKRYRRRHPSPPKHPPKAQGEEDNA